MKRLIGITAITASAVCFWIVWVVLERNVAEFRMERERLASRARNYKPFGQDGGNGVKILQFYATSGVLIEGQRGIVCYGVENARAVRLDPPVDNVYPAYSRCFWVEPKQDTTYTLTAEGFDGREISQSFRVKLKPAPPGILFVSLSANEIRRGDPLTVCYGVEHADAVRLEPLNLALDPTAKACRLFYPPATLKYTLVAAGPNGPPDKETFTVKVR